MKQVLLSIIFLSFSFLISAQQDTTAFTISQAGRISGRETQSVNVNIYPVPVRENNFTIQSDKEFISVKITNVIGQDIFRVKYNTPQNLSKVFLDNPQRGLYIVTIAFSDESRIVRKIMIESYN
jgi:hypothetical protein